jgi:hypothetical protein
MKKAESADIIYPIIPLLVEWMIIMHISAKPKTNNPDL